MEVFAESIRGELICQFAYEVVSGVRELAIPCGNAAMMKLQLFINVFFHPSDTEHNLYIRITIEVTLTHSKLVTSILIREDRIKRSEGKSSPKF